MVENKEKNHFLSNYSINRVRVNVSNCEKYTIFSQKPSFYFSNFFQSNLIQYSWLWTRGTGGMGIVKG